MRSLKTREAAGLLNISPNTLRVWEQKYGFPKPIREPGRHRSYVYAEIAALRDALEDGLAVASAISVVRDGLGSDTDALVRALLHLDRSAADLAMETSLSLRSLERSVDEVLLPALNDLGRRAGQDSLAGAVACRWALDWLARVERLVAPEADQCSVVVADACGGVDPPERAQVRALQLFCERRGVGVLIAPVETLKGLPEALRRLRPRYIVIAGGRSRDDLVARWAFTVRQVLGPVPVALYLRPVRAIRPAPNATVLPGLPREASEVVVGAARRSNSRTSASPDETHDVAPDDRGSRSAG